MTVELITELTIELTIELITELIIESIIESIIELIMIIDAILYPDIYTFAWKNYAVIVLSIHLLFFLCGTNFRRAFAAIRSFMHVVRDRYNFALIMYNDRHERRGSKRK